MLSVRVEQLATDSSAGLSVTVLAGRTGLSRRVTVPRIQKPGLALTGYGEQVHPERVQVLGNTEISYLTHLPPAERVRGIGNLVHLQPACILLTRALTPPPEMVAMCDERGVALMVSPLMSSVVIDRVTKYLE